MTANLTGKVAFVTGGSRGIGAAIVQRLSNDGATVAFTYKGSSAAAQSLAERIEKDGGRALALQADAADAAAVGRTIDEAAARFGKIDILVNNAGVLALGPIETFSLGPGGGSASPRASQRPNSSTPASGHSMAQGSIDPSAAALSLRCRSAVVHFLLTL